MSSSSRFDRLTAGGMMLLSLAALSGGPAWAAELRGSVVLEGPPPAPQKLTIKAKSKEHSIEGCGAVEKLSPKLIVDAGGGLKDAVVWVETPTGMSAGPDPIMDQDQCVFEPHVLAIQAGGSVAIRNSDSVIHNVRIFPEGVPSMLMHQWQKADAADILWRFGEPGRYVVRCGVHPWMYGWVVVIPPGSAAVTGPSGSFTLAGVPPGRHTLRVWHETLGTLEVPVEVGPDGKQLEPVRIKAGGR